MYSDISKRNNLTPIIRESCLQISVLPTPVGPANKNEPIGCSMGERPERDSFIALESDSTAVS